MGSYILQREKYLSKVVELRSESMGYGRISKIIPVPEETIRRWCVKFAPTTQQVHSTMKKSAQTKESGSGFLCSGIHKMHPCKRSRYRRYETVVYVPP